METPKLGDWLKSINTTKVDIMTPENESTYVPFFVARSFSYFPDTIFIADRLNQSGITDKSMHYHLLLRAVPQKSRYSPWNKKTKLDIIPLIKQFFEVSTKKALVIERILTQTQKDTLSKLYEHTNSDSSK